MRRAASRLAAVSLAVIGWVACSSFGSNTDDITASDAASPEGSSRSETGAADGGGIPDAPLPACDVTKPFGAPVALTGSINTDVDEGAPTLTDDELTMYFNRVAGGQVRIYVATRTSRTADFGAPAQVSELNPSSPYNVQPAISGDGSVLFFASYIVGQLTYDVYQAVRGPTGRFGSITSVGSVNTFGVNEDYPSLAAHGEELWFARGATPSVFRAPVSADGGVGSATLIPELSSNMGESGFATSRDGLTVFFGSARSGGMGNSDVWTAHRDSMQAKFSTPEHVPNLSSGKFDVPHWLSVDGCRLYLASDLLGTYDLYVASRH